MGQALLAVHDYGNFNQQNITAVNDLWHRVEVESECKIIDFRQDGFTTKQPDGITTTVLRHKTPMQTARVLDLFNIKSGSKERYFLISSIYRSPHVVINNDEAVIDFKRPKKITGGRKKTVRASHLEVDGEWHEVIVGKDGNELEYQPDIFKKMVRQLDLAIGTHKRVLLYRFELRMKSYASDNKVMTQLFDRLIKKLKREYAGIHSIAYGWAREIETGKGQHYHCFIALDGDKVRYPARLRNIIVTIWDKMDIGHKIPHIDHPYYFIDSDLQRSMAIKRISYLAKPRGKGYRDKQTKDFGTSRLQLRI